MASINTEITSFSAYGTETTTTIVGDSGRTAWLKIRSGGVRCAFKYSYTDFDGDRYVVRTNDWLHETMGHQCSHDEFDPDNFIHLAFLTAKLKQIGRRFPAPVAA
jgi:hypothetical protein|tara:strand:- start:768 stop:1082 length:315 start_codon:yes stop_codon:yes gene_type:complete